MKLRIIIPLILFSHNAVALTFNEAIKKIDSHQSVESILSQSKVTKEEGSIKASWGDPHLKLAAKNFPKDNLSDDQTPMTGIEFGISQKIALSTKYSNIGNAYLAMAKAQKLDANDQKQFLKKMFWEILILKNKAKEELVILNENNRWIEKLLKISKRLYSTGKASQQALLDIQIRKSEIESEISNKNYELRQLEDQVMYLTGVKKVESESIPWGLLSKNEKKTIKDFKFLSLEEKVRARNFGLTASKQNYLPDMTVSLGITKRSDIDGNGDFVGASISMPLPFSSTKYANHEKAVQAKYVATKNFEHYKISKNKEMNILKNEIEKIQSEIEVLETKTIKFATNSREITAKSYGLGNSTYVEMLQSELKLQKILMHKVMLEANLYIKQVTLKYVTGEPLDESL